jgi:hypothetical protein
MRARARAHTHTHTYIHKHTHTHTHLMRIGYLGNKSIYRRIILKWVLEKFGVGMLTGVL